MILYVTEQGACLGLKRVRIEVKKGKNLLGSYRIQELESIALYGNIQVSCQALKALLKEGVEVNLLSMSGAFQGRLVGPTPNHAALRYLQYQKLDDPAVATAVTRACVKGKLHNQRALLLRYQRRVRNQTVATALLGMRMLSDGLRETEEIDVLRGMEGAGAAAYFRGFGQLFKPDDITFTKRLRRPPPDPVNILLSLGYTLLGHLVQGCVELAKMDPYVGALHRINYNRPSLALDLLEEWRPVIVDALVLRAFNNRELRAQHFVPAESEGGAPLSENESGEANTARRLLLTPEGSKRWFAVYEGRLEETVYYPPKGAFLSYRQCIREQVFAFARFLRGESDSYQPFCMTQ